MVESEMRPIATPWPLFRPEFHCRPDRIQVDVTSVDDELSVRDDRDALESIAKQMTSVTVLHVPIARVFPKQFLHSLRQTSVRDLQQQVEVIRHLAVAEDRPAVFPGHACEQREVMDAIIFTLEDRTSIVAPRRNMVDATRLHNARRSRHASTIGTADWLARQRHTFCTQLTHLRIGV